MTNTDRLPDDYFTIFKNITKFSWVEKDLIESVLKKKYKTIKNMKFHTKYRYFDSVNFRKFKNSHPNSIQENPENYGIPQGAPISSVLSNIYLLDFDKIINEYVRTYNGLYRRYCDDLIIVIPYNDETNININFNESVGFLNNSKEKIPNLIINDDKTEVFFYEDSKISDEKGTPAILDYLGFTFDGYNVRIRERSISKFYSRAYKKVKFCNWNYQKYGRKKYIKSLYEKYTHLGKNKGKYGNFLSYVSRAQRIFDEDSTTNNLMVYQIKNHWKYIQSKLNNSNKK